MRLSERFPLWLGVSLVTLTLLACAFRLYLILRGRAEEWRLRLMAQELARTLLLVSQVEGEVEVQVQLPRPLGLEVTQGSPVRVSLLSEKAAGVAHVSLPLPVQTVNLQNVSRVTIRKDSGMLRVGS
ncbi:MAG: hypothetical protein QXW77_00060 [Candidatus Hadarchaeales archaeon]